MSTEESVRQLTDASRLLSSQRRLYALLCLREADRPVTLAELAADVTAQEREINRESLSHGSVQAAYLSLYHTHIPKLSESGVVEYDRESSTVRLAEGGNQVDVVIDAVFDHESDAR